MFYIAQLHFYLISFTGQRIPVIDTDGGSAVKGFKLRRQPTESTRERTCCWQSRKQFGPILSSFLFYFWLVTKDNSRWRMWCHRGSCVTSFWSQKKVQLRMVWDIYSESRCTSLRKDKNALIQLLYLILPVLQPPFKCLRGSISVLSPCPESDSNENTCLTDQILSCLALFLSRSFSFLCNNLCKTLKFRTEAVVCPSIQFKICSTPNASNTVFLSHYFCTFLMYMIKMWMGESHESCHIQVPCQSN